MSISNDLIKKFVQITKDQSPVKHESTVYGTAVEYNDTMYVQIDGSELLTPVDTSTEIADGERVTVLIKDHTATVTGNLTSPSIGSSTVVEIQGDLNDIGSQITEFEVVIADKVSTKDFEANNAAINNLLVGKADINELNAVKADIGTLQAEDATIKNLVAGKADIDDLNATRADIEELVAGKAEIGDLNAAVGNINDLTADIAKIALLIGGNASIDAIQSIILTSQNTSIENAMIKNAMIANITADKISSGTINTNKVNIQSEDGGIEINGSTQQFKDQNGNVRVQIGKDAQGNFTFCLFSQDGSGILLDHEGIKAGAVPDGLIVDDMVADNANISGGKLDISSVVTEINNNSTTIKSSLIQFDDSGQSLLVAFNSLKDTVDEITEITIDGDLSGVLSQIQTLSTQLNVAQGQIDALITNTTIIAENGEAVLLKDDYSQTKQTVNGISTKVGSLETEMGESFEEVTSKQSALEQSLNGFKSTVSSTYTTKTEFNNLDIGGRNLLLGSGEGQLHWNWALDGATIDTDFTLGTEESGRDKVFVATRKSTTVNPTSNVVYYDAEAVINSELLPSTEYVLSFDIMVSEPVSIMWKICNVDGGSEITDFSEYVNIPANTWFKFESTVISFDNFSLYDPPRNYLYLAGFPYSPNSSFRIKNPKLEKGNKATDWTPATEDLEDNIESSISASESTLNNVITDTANNVRDELNKEFDNYVTKDSYNEHTISMSSAIEQTNSDVTIKFEQTSQMVESIEGQVTTLRTNVETNIRFDENGIEIGKSDSPFSVNINNSKMSFREGTKEIAYISNNEMKITDANIQNSLTLGAFKFFPRSTGNVSLVWDDSGNMISYTQAYPNAILTGDVLHRVELTTPAIPGDIYTVEICGDLGDREEFDIYNLSNESNAKVEILGLYNTEFRNGIVRKSFVWTDTDSYGSILGGNTALAVSVYPFEGSAVHLSYIKLYPGDEYWKDYGNLLSYNNVFTEAEPYIMTAQYYDDTYKYTGIYAYLEAGKTYEFTCKHDKPWWDEIETGNDCCQAYMYALVTQDNFIHITSDKFQFTVPYSGRWGLRLDANITGETYKYWDMKIVEVKPETGQTNSVSLEEGDE